MPLYSMNNNQNKKYSLFSKRRSTGIIVFLLSLVGYFSVFTSYLPLIKSFLFGVFGIFIYAILFALSAIGSALIAEKKLINDKNYLVYLITILISVICIFSLAFNKINLDLTYGEYLIEIYKSKVSISGLSTALILYPIVYFIGYVGAYVLFLVLLVLGLGLGLDYHSKIHTKTTTKFSKFFLDDDITYNDKNQNYLNPIFESTPKYQRIENNKQSANQKPKVSLTSFHRDELKQNNSQTNKFESANNNINQNKVSQNGYTDIFKNYYPEEESSVNVSSPIFEDYNFFDSKTFNEKDRVNQDNRRKSRQQDLDFLYTSLGRTPVQKVENNYEDFNDYSRKNTFEEFNNNDLINNVEDFSKNQANLNTNTFNGYAGGINYNNRQNITSQNFENQMQTKLEKDEQKRKVISNIDINNLMESVNSYPLNRNDAIKKEDIEDFVETNKYNNKIQEEQKSENKERNLIQDFYEKSQNDNDYLNQDSSRNINYNENILDDNEDSYEENRPTKKEPTRNRAGHITNKNSTIIEDIENGEFSSTINPDDKNKPKVYDFVGNKPIGNFNNEVKQPPKRRPYVKPPISLLSDIDIVPPPTNSVCSEKALRIEATLKSFGINAKVVDYIVGPAITRFRVEIPAGVQMNRIATYSNDIKASVECVGDILIQAPIPGTKYVGIDVPNKEVSAVPFKELISSLDFINSPYDDVFVLGKTITGQIITCRLDKMPHMLIAGSTGSGKSVCLNTIILSLIYHSSPEDLRMVLIDPKFVEFSAYSGIPHMLIERPINNHVKALKALQYIEQEMNNRYLLFQQANVKNLEAYNKCELVKSGQYPKKPKILIIIDEFAELISKNKKELEATIESIGQMARAAGIFLILATQRPDANVVTGNLKNNLPTKISFKLGKAIDSRTILDESGAEGLVGRGDMLYKGNGKSELERIQGCYVLDDDIPKVVEFVKKNNDCFFDEEIEDTINKMGGEVNGKSTNTSSSNQNQSQTELSDEELIPLAIKAFLKANCVSKSMLQRKLAIGFNRAARIVETMIDLGYIYIDNSNRLQLAMSEEEFESKFGDL